MPQVVPYDGMSDEALLLVLAHAEEEFRSSSAELCRRLKITEPEEFNHVSKMIQVSSHGLTCPDCKPLFATPEKVLADLKQLLEVSRAVKVPVSTTKH